jgi:acyl-CoA synthetase (AMP-forming)/AMP-acid ligase II
MTQSGRRAGAVISTRMTLWEAFEAVTAAAPGREALVAGDGRVTNAELAAAALAFSGRLSRAGVRPGQAVLLLLPNSVRYAAALFAVARAGAVAVPLDPGLAGRELAQVAAVTAARVVVVGTAGSAQAVRDALASAGSDCPVVRYDSAEAGPGEPPWPAPGAAGPTDPADRPAASDPAVLFLTSGTTGTPKCVAHSHRSLLASFLALQRMHREFFEGPASERIRRVATVARRYGRRVIRAAGHQTWMTAIPFHAIGGHEVLTGTVLGGHTLVTTASFHPRRTMELLAAHKVNVFPATPAMVETMLSLRDFGGFDLSSLLVVGLGGAPASPDLVRRAQARFGCSITVGYGATELGGGVLVTRIDDADQVKRETVGRPFPGADIRIVDGDGRDVAAGVSGELLCRTGGLMAGYAAAPGEQPADGAVVDEAGWYHTSDLAVRDEDGNVRIVGRQDDLIIRGGSKIRPAEVEQVLDSAAGVARSAVVGVAAGRVGQQVWAFVVPRAGGPPVDRAALLAHCRANLATHKVPDHIRVCESLPLTSLGKVQRYRLAQAALREGGVWVLADGGDDHGRP